ncbi:MAG TPA: NAD-dependent epimerase/dehydratase family protein [Solimonas sp.]|nr:NAD-dependent epimerase/dehydratase family protein [Solimonas sp.]
MQLAITGGSGYVGTNLVRLLLQQGHQVRVIDRSPPRDLGRAGLSYVEANILDPQQVAEALKGVEILFHLVAKITLAEEDPVAWTLNVDGVRVVAEAALASGVRRMVHCSSIHAFDQYRCGGHITLDSARSTARDIPVYDRSKWAGEQELQKVIAKGLDAVICNPTGVYGPVDYTHSRVNDTLLQSGLGKLPAITEGGFDFVDVRDVAKGLALAAEKGRTGANYILGGHYLSMMEITRLAAQAVGRPGPRRALPLWLLRLLLPLIGPLSARSGREPMTKASIAAIAASPHVDLSATQRDLGYAPRPAAESTRDLMAFYIGTGKLAPEPGVSLPALAEDAL